MEAHFSDELQLLSNALRTPSFRFIVVAHNRRSVYLDIKNWLIEKLGDSRDIKEFALTGKDSMAIRDTIKELQKGILLIPDLDFLLRDENAAQSVYFNQRRDSFARLDIAFICFIQPSNFQKVAEKLPDWWSLRSLELEFIRDTTDEPMQGRFMRGDNLGPLSNLTVQEKEEQLNSLLGQIERTNPENKALLILLFSQVGELYFVQANYDKAFEVLQKMLELSITIGDYRDESTALNNISQIYQARGDYDTALRYLEQSLSISKQISDIEGESATLNNLAAIAKAKGDYDTALRYLEHNLSIQRQIGDSEGQGTTLNNLAVIAIAKGNLETALHFLESGLSIQRQIGNLEGEGSTLNNISQIYDTKGDYDTALRFLEQSLIIRLKIGDIAGLAGTLTNIGAIFWEQKRDVKQAIPHFIEAYQIFQRIGSPDIKYPKGYLDGIKSEIGEAAFKAILLEMDDSEK